MQVYEAAGRMGKDFIRLLRSTERRLDRKLLRLSV